MPLCLTLFSIDKLAMVASTVSSKMLEAMAAEEGFQFVECLTGQHSVLFSSECRIYLNNPSRLQIHRECRTRSCSPRVRSTFRIRGSYWIYVRQWNTRQRWRRGDGGCAFFKILSYFTDKYKMPPDGVCGTCETIACGGKDRKHTSSGIIR